MEVAARFEQLAAARAAAEAVREEYSARRTAILEQVHPQLDAVDAEFADRLQAVNDEASRAEAEARRRTEKVRNGAWEVVFSAHEQVELKAFLDRLRTEGRLPDPDLLRIDVLCGRLAHLTSYQVSVFRPTPSGPSRTLGP